MHEFVQTTIVQSLCHSRNIRSKSEEVHGNQQCSSSPLPLRHSLRTDDSSLSQADNLVLFLFLSCLGNLLSIAACFLPSSFHSRPKSSNMSSNESNANASDSKLATGTAPAGMNSITNTVGMQPVSNESSPPVVPSNIRRGSCDLPGCTAEHSGKPHQ